MASSQHTQRQRQWWQQGPLEPACTLLQGFQQSIQRFAASPPWAHQQHHQQQEQRQHHHQQQQQHQHQQQLDHHHQQRTGTAGGGKQQRAPTASAGAEAPPRRAERHAAAPQHVTREELGRATWVFLHTLAAQFPERPTRQQQRDARSLMDVLTRIYPCADCARHFSEIVK
jgi:hypothetical protein